MSKINQVTFPGQPDEYKDALEKYCQGLTGSKVFRAADGAVGTIYGTVRQGGEVFVKTAYPEDQK